MVIKDIKKKIALSRKDPIFLPESRHFHDNCIEANFKGFYQKIISKDELQQLAQKSYDEAVSNINLNQVRCDHCGKLGDFNIHGYYDRNIQFGENSVRILLTRVICNGCDCRTHALMFGDFIPYSKINTEKGLVILQASSSEQEIAASISYETIKNIITRYKLRFKELFMIYQLNVLEHSIMEIVRKLIYEVRLTFLQIHRGRVLPMPCRDRATT